MKLSETKTVTIPMQVWGRLATEADHREVQVEDVLVGAINRVILRSHRHAIVLGLNLLGHSDRAIADVTGEGREFIREARRAVGLPPRRDAEEAAQAAEAQLEKASE